MQWPLKKLVLLSVHYELSTVIALVRMKSK